MVKTKTLQVRDSENNLYSTKIDRDFFRLYCEENGELQKSMDDLIRLRDTSEDDRVRVDINKWLIEQLIGRPSQNTDITSKGESIAAGIFIEGLDDDKEV
ncbi:MAG: hypothetical protein BWY21_01564 [Parcubacteria group bacterium ADurb.Bin216]|nr:MAG: hypothetical protein BWY21_01564 [Parcubacteria group bacterium ADurb.Bin216]